MRRKTDLAYEFVKSIPDSLAERTLYVSVEYATVAHKCCCGCGREVVTPLSPTDWKLTYDGISISLSPSVGNWSFDCESHYWIVKNTVRWADLWSAEEINAGREHARRTKEKYYATDESSPVNVERTVQSKSSSSFWSRLPKLWARK